MNDIETKLRDRLLSNWEYKIIKLFNGGMNPKTGKKLILHVLLHKDGKDVLWEYEDVEV